MTAIHSSMLHVPCYFVSFFPFGNGVLKYQKNATNLFMSNLGKFQKFIISSISRFGKIKEVWYKDWKISLYKPGQVRACFRWIIEKSKIIQFKISFHNNNFCVDFFSKMQILSYLVKIFLVWIIGITRIKIQISIVCLEKKFL